MTRGLLRRGRSLGSTNSAPRVRVRARAHLSTPSGMRNRSFADIASVRALSPGQARLVTCQTQQQTRVVHNKRVSPHTLPNDFRRDRGGARAGASARSRSASRPIGATNRTLRRRDDDVGSVSGASVAAARRRTRQTLSSKITSTEESDKTAAQRFDSLFAARRVSSFSNRRAVNSGERSRAI